MTSTFQGQPFQNKAELPSKRRVIFGFQVQYMISVYSQIDSGQHRLILLLPVPDPRINVQPLRLHHHISATFAQLQYVRIQKKIWGKGIIDHVSFLSRKIPEIDFSHVQRGFPRIVAFPFCSICQKPFFPEKNKETNTPHNPRSCFSWDNWAKNKNQTNEPI